MGAAQRCSVLQCVAVCCSVLLRCWVTGEYETQSDEVYHGSCSVQCVAVCCSVLQCVVTVLGYRVVRNSK